MTTPHSTVRRRKEQKNNELRNFLHTTNNLGTSIRYLRNLKSILEKVIKRTLSVYLFMLDKKIRIREFTKRYLIPK